MKEVLNIILVFLRLKKKEYIQPITEHEREIFEKAKQKNFKPTVDIIQKIAIGGDFTIALNYKPLKSENITNQFPIKIINNREPGLPFKITLKEYLDVGGVLYKESYGLTKSLTILKGNEKLYTNSDSVVAFKTQFPSLPQILEGKLINLRSFEKLDESYFRLVIHTHDTDMTYPTDILEFKKNHMKFDYPAWDRQRSMIGLSFISTKGMYADITVHGLQFDFYGVENINSVIIDSNSKMSLEDFKKYTYAIRVCFAFLSGKFYKDEVVYLSSPNQDFGIIDHFEYILESPSIISNGQIVNPTFFFQSFSNRSKEEQESLKEFHNMFDIGVFSNLCEKVIESPELLRCIELLVNAGNINDPIQKGAMYSVAIETLTEYLKDLNEEALKPIPDKATWEEFLKAQRELLATFNDKINANGLQILDSKIGSLNTPTNRDKLMKPFEIYGLEISDEDIQTLGHRNKYLHGGSPSDTEWVAEQDMIALKLHNLVGALILKFVGYRGHYINLAAWHIMHLTETNDRMEKIDLNQMEEINARIAANDFDAESLASARKYIENYQKFLKSIAEIHDVIRIIE